MLHVALGKLYAEQISSGSAAGWHHYPHSKNRAWKRHPLSLCHSRNSGPHLVDLLTVTIRPVRSLTKAQTVLLLWLSVNTKT